MHKRGKKVQILNKVFASLIGQVLIKNQLNEVIKEGPFKKDEDAVYLLVGNAENIRSNLDTSLSSFPREKVANFHFVIGIPPVIGGEEKFARLIDYLYTQSEEITNLSKKEYLSLGVSFYDFKLLIQLLQPNGIITLQNSYKNVKFFDLLPVNFLTLDNCYS
jgi:mRNA degradation ribonuclease J1/J2